MYKVELTTKEKAELERRHRATKDVVELDRIKAVLLRSEGWEIQPIAQALRVHVVTITRHVKDYLRAQKTSVSMGGSSSLLTSIQLNELSEHLEENLYHYTHEIAVYISHRYGVTYSISGLNKLLHRMGLSYKKCKGRPYKANPLQQEQFIKDYEKLKSSLKVGDTVRMAEVSFPQYSALQTGWEM